MTVTVLTGFILNLLALILGLFLDLVFGEPPERLHPTVWMGRVIASLKPFFNSQDKWKGRFRSILFWIICVALFTVPAFVLVTFAAKYLGAAGYVIVSAIILKTSFALKSWDSHAIPVAEALKSGKIDEARKLGQKTVRRDLSSADEQHVVSASVETIAEGIVDGYASPIFYFALLAAPGAIAYRMINTLDSMVGYKDEEHRNLGWFSAKMDTLANYVPARITGYVMLLASSLAGENWRRAKNIFVRYRGTIESPNAGWPMSVMAGALGVRLEKTGNYRLGEANELLTACHIYRAMNIMKTTCALFTIIVALPLTYGIQLLQRLMVII
jgi:adenosylcobinamide-phosphate synthase